MKPLEKQLAELAEETRRHTLAFVAELDDDQMMGPRLVLNPLRWEIAHCAWFAEHWIFRRAGNNSIIPGADALYDSAAVAHATRWDLDLLPREETYQYMRDILDRVLDLLASGKASDEDLYHVRYAIGHEQMHCEAFTRTLQWHGWPAPTFAWKDLVSPEAGACPGDVEVAGGTFELGARPDSGFVFDNEKWAHPVEVKPFKIARAPVTQAEFAAFVDDAGYTRPELWSDDGWAWRSEYRAPINWRTGEGGWERRHFADWVALEPHRPVCHVSWHEAQAFCQWANRRLPTEAEWEMAAAWDGESKRHYPWGDEPGPASFDWCAGGSVDVGAFPEADSPAGCRQMLGNVWEWTADPLSTFPGFTPDPYKDYTLPWLGDHYVLKGGSWASFSVLHRNTYRKYHEPHRRDPFCGFRTCACE